MSRPHGAVVLHGWQVGFSSPLHHRVGAGSALGSFAGVLAVGCIVLAILNGITTSDVPRRLLVFLGFGLMALELLAFRDTFREQLFLVVLGAWITVGLLVNGMTYGTVPKEWVYLPGNLAIALALLRNQVPARALGILFALVSGYLAIRLFQARESGLELATVITSGSANVVSIMTLVLAAIYYIRSAAEGRWLGLWPAILVFLVNALALGRSGIAAAGLFVGIVLAVDIRLQPTRRGVVTRLALLVTVVSLAAVYVVPRFEAYAFVFDRFREWGASSQGRQRILADYMDRLHASQFLFGFDREAELGGYRNVHNSFLFWHKSMGLLAIPVYLVTIWAVIRGTMMRVWLPVLLFLTLLARAAFDEMFLPFRLFDFAYFYLVTLLLFVRPQRSTDLSGGSGPGGTGAH